MRDRSVYGFRGKRIETKVLINEGARNWRCVMVFRLKDESEEKRSAARYPILYPLSLHNELPLLKHGDQWGESVNARCSTDFNE